MVNERLVPSGLMALTSGVASPPDCQPGPLRVVYGASGMHVVAALAEAPNAVTEHKLHWGAVNSREEGWYLCVILNCPEPTQLVRPLMSYGKDERDT